LAPSMNATQVAQISLTERPSEGRNPQGRPN
jgi:hypothetical protein